MSHRSLIISTVFTCEQLAVNLHVNKNVVIKTSLKQPSDERISKGFNVQKKILVKEKFKCHQHEFESFMKNTHSRGK